MEVLNQKTDTPADFTDCGRTGRSSHWRCFIKNPVLKNFAISTGSTCVGVSFKKVTDLNARNFIKKRPQ